MYHAYIVELSSCFQHIMEENKYKYTANNFEGAVTEVRKGKSYREASRGSGVPVTTKRYENCTISADIKN